jgi:hypothetical protein
MNPLAFSPVLLPDSSGVSPVQASLQLSWPALLLYPFLYVAEGIAEPGAQGFTFPLSC